MVRESKDEALEMALDSLLVFREIHGPERMVDLLEHELTREICLAKSRNGTAVSSLLQTSAAEQNAARQLRIAFDALEFYAARDNYERDSSKQPSPVAADKGRKAREAIEAIDQDAPDDAGE